MLRAALLSVGLTILATAAWAAAPDIGPLATAQDIRARHAQSSGSWRLTYRQVDSRSADSPVTLELASDYVLRQDKDTQIFDFAQARVYSRAGNGAEFGNDSLHALVLFRIHELQNRKTMAGALAAAKIDKPPAQLDALWAESDLSMTLPGQPAELERRNEAEGFALWKGETLAARAALGPEAPAPVRGKLLRLWRHALPLHPQMARELAVSGRAPASLELPAAEGDAIGARKLTLVKAEWIEQAEFPLPANAVPAPDRGSPATMALLDAARTAARTGARALTLEAYVGRMRDALGRGAALEAALWAMEAVLAGSANMTAICPAPQHATEPCPTFRQAFASGMADPRAPAIFGKGPLKMQTSLPDLSGLSSAHVGRLMLATRLAMGGGRGTVIEDSYRAALAGGPGVAGYYKDIGDYYVRGYEHPTAWRLYDLARALPGHRDGDLLSEIDRMEAKLRKDFPELY